MKGCHCPRLYALKKPDLVVEYVFRDTLCRIREFKTDDGLRYCLTLFDLLNCKHVHFQYAEYKSLISELWAQTTMQTIRYSEEMATRTTTNPILSVVPPFVITDDFKIKLGKHNLNIAAVTGFGLIKTSPMDERDVYCNESKNIPACDFELEICTCKGCTLYSRLNAAEVIALNRAAERRKQLKEQKRIEQEQQQQQQQQEQPEQQEQYITA